MGRLLLAAGWLALLGRPAAGWQATWPGVGNALARDPGGGVVVAGQRPGRFPVPSFEVESLTGAGRRRWRFRGELGWALTVAVDPAGDVVVGGYVREGSVDAPTTFTVLKLDGRRGREIWRTQPSLGEARSLAVGSGGDVIAVGVDDPHGNTLTVARLAGQTGRVEWQHALASAAGVAETPVAVDAGDGVVVAGGSTVWSLAADGGERWRVTLPGTLPEASSLGLGAGGDVFVARADTFVVARLAAADGSERWHVTLAPFGDAASLVVDPAGDVLAGGNLGGVGGAVFGVAKLDGATGAERWRGTVGAGAVHALALDGAGTVVATGRSTRRSADAGSAFAIAGLAAETGAVRWRRFVGALSTTAPGSGEAVAIDRTGHAVAIGTTGLAGAERAIVVRVSRR